MAWKAWPKPVERYRLCATCFIPVPIEYTRAHEKWHDSLNEFLVNVDKDKDWKSTEDQAYDKD